MVEEILKMYFEEHMKQKDIADYFKVSAEYVSKVVRNDDRYQEEKQRRHQEAKLRKAKYNKEYLETYERKKDKSDKEDYEKLQALLDSDTRQMSRHSFGISTDAFVKSNISVYKQDKDGNLILDDKIKTSYALPKKYKRKVKRLYKEQVR